jgi:hypothetical protein
MGYVWDYYGIAISYLLEGEPAERGAVGGARVSKGKRIAIVPRVRVRVRVDVCVG